MKIIITAMLLLVAITSKSQTKTDTLVFDKIAKYDCLGCPYGEVSMSYLKAGRWVPVKYTVNIMQGRGVTKSHDSKQGDKFFLIGGQLVYIKDKIPVYIVL